VKTNAADYQSQAVDVITTSIDFVLSGGGATPRMRKCGAVANQKMRPHANDNDDDNQENE
jgi:hypothetical protein